MKGAEVKINYIPHPSLSTSVSDSVLPPTSMHMDVRMPRWQDAKERPCRRPAGEG